MGTVMSASPIRYDGETVDGKWAARVIIDADAFYGHGDTKEEARRDLIKVVERASSNMLAWVKEQSAKGDKS